MRDLNELRIEIDSIDSQLIQLFEKRMDIVKEVIEYKLSHDMPIYQSDREKEVLKKNLSKVENKELIQYASMFLENMMHISKSYQSDIKDKKI